MRGTQSFLDAEEGDQRVLQGVVGFAGAMGTLLFEEIEGNTDMVSFLLILS